MDKTKYCLVEGKDDFHSFIHLMGAHTPWNNPPPVKLKSFDGFEKLTTDYLSVEFKAPNVQAIGVVVDADEQCKSRWDSVRSLIEPLFQPTPQVLPKDLPKDGLVVTHPNGVRIGVWIMPDNDSKGMLETFLSYLVPPAHQALWGFAATTCDQAKSKLQAPFKDVHTDKAKIHTFLAWTDPPGDTLGHNLAARVLDPTSPAAQSFVQWFMKLYDLPPLGQP